MSSLERPRPRGKSLPEEGVRRARVMQLVATQGLMALLLAGMAYLARHERETMLLFLWTLLVPLGFAGVYGDAYLRYERARREGAWSREWDKKETTRGYALLGGVFAVWVAGALAILALA